MANGWRKPTGGGPKPAGLLRPFAIVLKSHQLAFTLSTTQRLSTGVEKASLALRSHLAKRPWPLRTYPFRVCDWCNGLIAERGKVGMEIAFPIRKEERFFWRTADHLG